MNLSMKSYRGGDLKGCYIFTKKLDGVCVILDTKNRSALSKRGKELNNFEYIFDNYNLHGVFEVFRDNWETSVSLVRSKSSGNTVGIDDLVRLDDPDPKLCLDSVVNPTEYFISNYLSYILSEGNEGLVLIPATLDGVPE